MQLLAKISIIIPVYNLENEIGRCIKSVQAQTYKNIEMIVVDDGSSDKSAAVITSLASSDSRIVPVFKSNGGVTSARLEGVRHATGEWIGFVDGDDEIEENMYEVLLYNAEKNGADISHCGYQMIFPDGRKRYFYNSGDCVLQERNDAIRELLEGKRVEPGLWNKLFRKSLFCDMLINNQMDETIQINEDLLMNFLLFSRADKVYFEDRCLYHYLIRDTSASKSNLSISKILDPMKVKRIIYSLIESELKIDAGKAYMSTSINVYNTLLKKKEKDSVEEQESIRALLRKEKVLVRLLGWKRFLMASMLCHFPKLYSPLYKLYSEKIQINKYE